MSPRDEISPAAYSTALDLIDAILVIRLTSQNRDALQKSVNSLLNMIESSTSQQTSFTQSPYLQLINELRLLQSHVYYGVLEHNLKSIYRFQSLDSSPTGIQTTWVSDFDNSGDILLDERKPKLQEIFRNSRGSDGLDAHQEFVACFNRDVRYTKLTDEEIKNQFIWVRDEELSLMCLFWVLHFALKDSKKPTCEFQKWIDNEIILPAEYISNNGKDGQWEKVSFLTSMEKLGFIVIGNIASNSSSSDAAEAIQITSRLKRLTDWVKTSFGGEVWSKITGYEASELQVHFTKSATGTKNSQLQELQEIIRQLTYIDKMSTDENNASFLKKPPVEFEFLRFNIAGEYLLRKSESIVRSYFATPLQNTGELGRKAIIASFAVGTIQYTGELSSQIKRLRLIRAFLAAIGQIGSDLANFELNKSRSRILEHRDVLVGKVNELKSIIYSFDSEFYNLIEWFLNPPLSTKAPNDYRIWFSNSYHNRLVDGAVNPFYLEHEHLVCEKYSGFKSDSNDYAKWLVNIQLTDPPTFEPDINTDEKIPAKVLMSFFSEFQINYELASDEMVRIPFRPLLPFLLAVNRFFLKFLEKGARTLNIGFQDRDEGGSEDICIWAVPTMNIERFKSKYSSSKGGDLTKAMRDAVCGRLSLDYQIENSPLRKVLDGVLEENSPIKPLITQDKTGFIWKQTLG